MDEYKDYIVKSNTEASVTLIPQNSPEDPVTLYLIPQYSPTDSNGGIELEKNEDQADIDQMSSLDWVHGRDITYYHRNCAGSIYTVETFDNMIKASECTLCGMRIDSTLSHPSVTYPENEARLA